MPSVDLSQIYAKQTHKFFIITKEIITTKVYKTNKEQDNQIKYNKASVMSSEEIFWKRNDITDNRIT